MAYTPLVHGLLVCASRFSVLGLPAFVCASLDLSFRARWRFQVLVTHLDLHDIPCSLSSILLPKLRVSDRCGLGFRSCSIGPRIADIFLFG
ncbi:hypothetical protein B0H14DRAFT_2669619, partial [Mycena olivaceomarginata]